MLAVSEADRAEWSRVDDRLRRCLLLRRESEDALEVVSCEDEGVSAGDEASSGWHCVQEKGSTCEQRIEVGPCTSQKCVRERIKSMADDPSAVDSFSHDILPVRRVHSMAIIVLDDILATKDTGCVCVVDKSDDK